VGIKWFLFTVLGAVFVLSIGLGIGYRYGAPKPAEFMRFSQESLFQSHLRRDGQLRHGSLMLLGSSHIAGLQLPYVEYEVANFGIGGDSSAGLLKRVRRYQGLQTASVVILNTGINDFGHLTYAQSAKNITQIAEMLADVPLLIWTSLLPVALPAESHKVDAARTHTVNTLITELCAIHRRCRYIDVMALLSDSSGRLKPEYDSGDGIHLSTHGYQVWLKALSLSLPAFQEH
jgi:lysophospholipase L1-like esterase